MADGHDCTQCAVQTIGLPLGLEALVMTPNGVTLFFSFCANQASCRWST